MFCSSLLALVPDKDVRVSVKALAISCVGAAVALYPEAFFSKLYKMPTESNKEERGRCYVDSIKKKNPLFLPWFKTGVLTQLPKHDKPSEFNQ